MKSASSLCSAVCLLLLAGCSRNGGHYQKGVSALATGDQPGAMMEFSQAVYSGEQMAASHLELARIYETMPGAEGVALWHYSQAMSLSDSGIDREDIQQRMADCEETVLKRLSERRPTVEVLELRKKAQLLEEHAMKQNRWLEELRRDNLRLRRALGEKESE